MSTDVEDRFPLDDLHGTSKKFKSWVFHESGDAKGWHPLQPNTLSCTDLYYGQTVSFSSDQKRDKRNDQCSPRSVPPEKMQQIDKIIIVLVGCCFSIFFRVATINLQTFK